MVATKNGRSDLQTHRRQICTLADALKSQDFSKAAAGVKSRSEASEGEN